ncbi:hypothetical protein VTO73DRAFT_11429 [Trametes versicolor]
MINIASPPSLGLNLMGLREVVAWGLLSTQLSRLRQQIEGSPSGIFDNPQLLTTQRRHPSDSYKHVRDAPSILKISSPVS